MCGAAKPRDIELQAQALEALIHAVEDERSAGQAGRGRARAQSAGEGALSARVAPADRRRSCARVIGSEQHRAISEQMAPFA